MSITYTEQKIFTPQQVQELFLSVEWVSGQYPMRLYKALISSPTVITAWDNNRLVGLIRAIDDSELTAYIHYLLVHPDYRHRGIANYLVNAVKEKYKDYLYINVMPEESKNAAFYEHFGFNIMPGGIAMQVCNFSDRR